MRGEIGIDGFQATGPGNAMEFGEEQQVSPRRLRARVAKPQSLPGRVTFDAIAGPEHTANALFQFFASAVGDYHDFVFFRREVGLINPAPDAVFLADPRIE